MSLKIAKNGYFLSLIFAIWQDSGCFLPLKVALFSKFFIKDCSAQRYLFFIFSHLGLLYLNSVFIYCCYFLKILSVEIHYIARGSDVLLYAHVPGVKDRRIIERGISATFRYRLSWLAGIGNLVWVNCLGRRIISRLHARSSSFAFRG